MCDDSHKTNVHTSNVRLAHYSEEWNAMKLPHEDIMLAPEHVPPNPDDKDDLPDQHAIMGLRPDNSNNNAAWQDLGIVELAAGPVIRGPADVAGLEQLAQNRRMPR